MEPFELWSDKADIPVVAWVLKEDPDRKWTLYDLADRLRMSGWQVPAYPMPEDLTHITVQRIVVRNGLSMEMAHRLVTDMASHVNFLEEVNAPMSNTVNPKGFHH
jgi:glutamate decarboxylase